MSLSAHDLGELEELRGSPLPRIWTPRQVATTAASVVLELAGLLGLSVLEWQRLVLEVGLELRAGRWVRRTVDLLVARQNGKSLVLRLRVLAGLFLFGDRLILHAAQDRALARKHFELTVDLAESVPELRREIKKVRRANGTEELTLRSGASYRILAPSQDAFRGWTTDCLILDELREWRDPAVYSAALYTTQTAPSPQIWRASNAGDPESELLNRVRDRGRAAAERDHPRAAYLEWSAHEDDPIDDPRTWIKANPSLGYILPLEAIAGARDDDTEEGFKTEALCQWVDVSADAAIPIDAWLERFGAAGAELPTDGRVWYGIDLDANREAAALVAAWWVGDELAVHLLDSWYDVDVDEGTLTTAALTRVGELRPTGIGYDPRTAQGVADKLEAALGEEMLTKLTAPRWYTASGQLFDAVAMTKQLVHPGDDRLTDQVKLAARREISGDTWKISRADSAAPIPAVMALAAAVHLAVSPEPEAGFFVYDEDDDEDDDELEP